MQLAGVARALQPHLQVVLSSGYGEAVSDPGAWSLPKPYGLPELQVLVERAPRTARRDRGGPAGAVSPQPGAPNARRT